jgi:hypothetical protein
VIAAHGNQAVLFHEKEVLDAEIERFIFVIPWFSVEILYITRFRGNNCPAFVPNISAGTFLAAYRAGSKE